MRVELRRPTERTCECCGRHERWSERSRRVAEPGEVFCVHEWDIDGSFVPLARHDETNGGNDPGADGTG